MNTVRRRQWIVVAALVLSLLPTAVLLDYSYLNRGVGYQLAFFARIAGVAGTVLLMWEIILGVRSLISRWTIDHMWILEVHKLIGIYGFTLIALHPLLITLSLWIRMQRNPFWTAPTSPFYEPMVFGVVAYILLVLIWFTSGFMRKRMGHRSWQRIHFLSYIIVPSVLLHNLGFNNNITSNVANVYWAGMLIVFVALVVYQTGFYTGWWRSHYKIVGVQQLTSSVIELVIAPVTGRRIHVLPGQFVYIQYPIVFEVHPYTATNFDAETGEITLAIKDLGPLSHLMQEAQIGDMLYVDGPYGVFTQDVYQPQRDVVFLSGGIGITPFLAYSQMWHRFPSGRHVYLFYGNKNETEIAYREKLDGLHNYTDVPITVVHVLEQPLNELPEQNYTSGFVSLELLQQHLPQPLANYNFLICGPPAMLKAMLKLLEKAAVPKSQISFEKFDN